jgi:hypothetical protein
MIREKEAVFCPNVLVLTLLNLEIGKKEVKFVRSLKRGLHHVPQQTRAYIAFEDSHRSFEAP